MGRATGKEIDATKERLFQSTPSVGRATRIAVPQGQAVTISIHALRGEGDVEDMSTGLIRLYISIHALRGEGDRRLS